MTDSRQCITLTQVSSLVGFHSLLRLLLRVVVLRYLPNFFSSFLPIQWQILNFWYQDHLGQIERRLGSRNHGSTKWQHRPRQPVGRNYTI